MYENNFMPNGVFINLFLWEIMAIFHQLLIDERLVCQQIIAVVCGWDWLGSVVHVITALYKLLYSTVNIRYTISHHIEYAPRAK